MSLHATVVERIGAPCREAERRHPARAFPATASPRQHVSFMGRWRAVVRRLHEIACLPELGGCEEELIDTRIAREGAVAER